MAEIYLIRHGKTIGNMQKRYVGSTDEPLCEAGISELNARRETILRAFSMCTGQGKKPDTGIENNRNMLPETVYVSPMIRCRQTAEILFPNAKQEIIPNLREMDFGQFEYKNYAELADDARYQAFIDSGGCLDFPDAEPQEMFRNRVRKAFLQCLEERMTFFTDSGSDSSREPFVFVVHGGAIMAILEAYARPHKNYFDWQVGAADGYRCVTGYEKERIYLENIRKIDKT